MRLSKVLCMIVVIPTFSLFALTAYSQDNIYQSADTVVKLERRLQGLCSTFMDDISPLDSLTKSDTREICKCAIPFTMDTVVAENLTDMNLIYRKLGANFFKCGESRIKTHWSLSLKKSRQHRRSTSTQISCVVEVHYNSFLDYFETKKIIEEGELQSRTLSCY